MSEKNVFFFVYFVTRYWMSWTSETKAILFIKKQKPYATPLW